MKIGSEMHAVEISTHTPLARRDGAALKVKMPFAYFYSHASCEA